MKKYLIGRLPEFILCTGISSAIVVNVCSGFILTDRFSGSFAAILVMAMLVQFVLILLACTRRSTILGIIGGAIAAIAVVIYAWKTEMFVDESANSVYIFLIVSIVSGLVVFLLGSTYPGCWILICVGIIVVAGTVFLQYPTTVWSYFLFFAGALTLAMHRRYSNCLKKVMIGRTAIFKHLIQALITVVIAGLIASGLFFAIVKPLNPPTMELKLIELLEQMDIFKVLGVSTTQIVYDNDLYSYYMDETMYDRDQEEEETETPTPTPEEEEQQNENEDTDEADQLAYDKLPFDWRILIVLLIILAAAALIAQLFIRRNLWHKKVSQLPARDAAANYYEFFLHRLKKVGLPIQDYQTTAEYAAENKIQLSVYATEDADFGELTRIYEKALYGRDAVTPEELGKFESFYNAFYKNVRKEIGNRRYFFKMWRM